MNTNHRPSIAFLGLGAMGQRMCAHLCRAGYKVTIWNRSAHVDHIEPLIALGAQFADSPSLAVAQADVVISILRDDEASRTVWLDSQHGALAAMPKHAVAVECSTLSLAWVESLAAAMIARGVAFVAAPAVGSRPQAEAAQLLFLAGGSDEVIDSLEPVLLHMGKQVLHVGSVNASAATKLLINTLFAGQVALIAELLGMAQSMQLDTLDRAVVLAAMAATPVLSPAANGAAQAMLAQQFAPMFPVELVRKDMDYLLQIAASPATQLPMTQSLAKVLQRAVEQGWAEQNLTVMAQLYR